MNAQLTEIMRLITNLIRTGTVTEVDRENWLCRVKVGELETNWINWLTLRAGSARTWWCPSPDEHPGYHIHGDRGGGQYHPQNR